MSDWFFSMTRAVVGNCRQLAQITVGKRRQPPPQKFFPPQVMVSGKKSFSGVEKHFPLLDLYQPQENFPLSSFLELCEVPHLRMKSDFVAQKLTRNTASELAAYLAATAF